MEENTRLATLGNAFKMLAVVALLATAALSGSVAAQDATATPTATPDPELADKRIAADNSTRSVYAQFDLRDAENVTNATATVTILGVEDGMTTELSVTNVTVSSGETQFVEEPVNASEYGAYRVIVEDTDGDLPEGVVSVGAVREVAGVGGAVSSTSSGFTVLGWSITHTQAGGAVFGVILIGALAAVGLKE